MFYRGTVVVILALSGCVVFDPDSLNRIETDAGVPEDQRMEDTFDAGPPPPSRRPLGRPGAETEGATLDSFVVAFKDVVMNQSGERWRTIGFDLDSVNTVRPDMPTEPTEWNVECFPPMDGSNPLVDGEQGIDNAFGDRLFPIIALAIPDLQDAARAGQDLGFGTLLLNVEEWNGDPDDPHVSLSMLQAAGGSPDPIASFDEDFNPLDSEGRSAAPPTWQGNDLWYARDDSFTFDGIADVPVLADNNGYVRDGIAHMKLPEGGGITFLIGRDRVVTVRLTDGFITTNLNPGDDFGDSLIAGRWSIIHLLDTAESVNICRGSTEKVLIDGQLQVVADIRGTPGSGGPGATCDALSFAVVFSGVRGTYVDTGPSFPAPTPCRDTRCSNGMLDEDEIEIDCGGECAPCSSM